MAETQHAMVSEWMSNGNINQFVKGHQSVNRFELVSPPSYGPYLSVTSTWFLQLSDVAKGLIYMHDQGMIHGGLKGVRLAKLNFDASPRRHLFFRATSWSIKLAMPALRILG